MWELDCEEGWVPKNWCFWTVVLEKTLESPLDCKEIQSVHSEGDQPWDFFGRNDAKAETAVLWPPHVKSWLIGKDWCWEGLGAGGEGDDRGWYSWMASLTRWTWIWVNSGSWWWTGSPVVLRFMGSQRVGQDWVTEQNWTEREESSFLDLVNDGFTLIQWTMILAKNAGHLLSLIDLFTVLSLEKVCFNGLANNTSIFVLPLKGLTFFPPHGLLLCYNSAFSDPSLQSRLL